MNFGTETARKPCNTAHKGSSDLIFNFYGRNTGNTALQLALHHVFLGPERLLKTCDVGSHVTLSPPFPPSQVKQDPVEATLTSRSQYKLMII
jgi:hypothetical protein